MTSTCNIQFDHNQKTLFAGQILRGTVKLTLANPQFVRNVYIHIFEETYANPSEASCIEDGCFLLPFYGLDRCGANQNWLDQTSYLVGRTSQGYSDTFDMQSGVYEYPSEFTLPRDLPTSTESSTGYVIYTARAVMKTLIFNQHYDERFYVIKAIDLNHVPMLREPVTVEKNVTLFPYKLLPWCTSNSIKIVFSTPVGGYTPGQTIHLEIDVDNQSNQQISNFAVRFIKQTIFPHNNDDTISNQITRGCSGKSQRTIHVYIEIPSVLHGDFPMSNTLQFRYLIRIIGLTLFQKNPVVEVPIIIGSYPIQHEIVSPDELSCNIDPPTYEEAMRLRELDANNL